MGFLEGLYNFFMDATDKMERVAGQNAKQNYRRTASDYNNKDPESVKKFEESKRKLEEFQENKVKLDSQKAKLRYEHDVKKAVQDGNKRACDYAAYEYEKEIEKICYDQQKLEQLKHNTEERISERIEFRDNVLPNIVNSIYITKETIKKIIERRPPDKTGPLDDGEQLWGIYCDKIDGNDKQYNSIIKAQEKIIRDVQIGKIDIIDDSHIKGNYGEMLVDSDMRNKNYIRISKDAITSLNDKIHQGIDAIYFNPDTTPNYIIVEDKYNKAQISKTKDGNRETSEKWLTEYEERLSADRIYDSLGKMPGEYSDDLAMEIFESLTAEDENTVVLLARISDDNTSITYKQMNCEGYVIGEYAFDE